MLHQLMSFAVKHWMLVSAFTVALILLFLEESKSQTGGADQLSAAGLTQLINKENPILIDLRDKDTFKNGHIIGSKNIVGTSVEGNEKKWESCRNKTIVLIDANGSQSGSLAKKLKKLAFEDVYVLRGGVAAWKTADMPLVKVKKTTKTKKKGE